jgi:hypothetical protein
MGPEPTKLGEQCTGNHLVRRAQEGSADPFCQGKQARRARTIAQEADFIASRRPPSQQPRTVEAFQEWSITGDRIESFYGDNAP